VIENEKNGWIVPIRSSEAISQAIVSLRQKSLTEYETMRQSARNAAMKFTWDSYQDGLANLIKDW